MKVQGCLLKAMQEVIFSTAVLVIDESNQDTYQKGPNDPDRFNLFPAIDISARQQKVIMLAQAYNCPIFLIQFERMLPQGTYSSNDITLKRLKAGHVTKIQLRALLPIDTTVINKHDVNAFFKTDLASLLAQPYRGRPVKNLVVMGWHSNVCVPATIGPQAIITPKVSFAPGWNIGPGAVDLNYTVLTCQQVLSGDDVEWSEDSPKIQFFSDF